MTQAERKPIVVERGVVASKSGAKTVRVFLSYMTKHPKYGKMLRRRIIAHVHDESNVARIGDTVDITKCRPMSKTKTWRLVRVVDSKATPQ